MKKNNQSGFALLLVFAMASIVAIGLYVSLPRVAFEAERDKEALLIGRGEQYTRAIQLYVRKTKRFPGKIEDLKNTNGIRFLRHQYIDPMTGKSEWRIIHAGPGGTLLDSLVQKQTKKDAAKVVDNFITELSPMGNALPTDTNTNPAMRHRPSDQAGAPGTQNTGPIPPDPGLVTGTPGLTATNVGQVPATPGPTAANPNLPRQPGAPTPAPAPSGGISTLPTFGGGPLPGQVPGQVTQQINAPNGQFPPGAGGATPGGANDASRLIQGLLTTPRPGGLAGLQGVPQQQGVQPQIIGGGIAGVASTYKGTGIKLYNDQDEVPKWEFIYDLSKDKTMNPAANIPQAAPAPGTPIGGTQTLGGPQSPGLTNPATPPPALQQPVQPTPPPPQ